MHGSLIRELFVSDPALATQISQRADQLRLATLALMQIQDTHGSDIDR